MCILLNVSVLCCLLNCLSPSTNDIGFSTKVFSKANEHLQDSVPVDTQQLILLNFWPSSKDAATDSFPFRLVLLNNTSIAYIDRGTGQIVIIDKSGHELRRWGRNELGTPQAISMSSDSKLYVQDGSKNKVSIYNEEGKLINSFKDYYRTINFNVSPWGEIYYTPYTLLEKKEEILLRLSDLGTPLDSITLSSDTSFPELNDGVFFSPLFSEDRIILVSKQFPVFLVFSKSGELLQEVQIIDRSLVERGLQNKGGRLLPNGDKREGKPIFLAADVLDDEIILNVFHLDSFLHFIRVNFQGQVVNNYLYEFGTDDSEDIVKLYDFKVASEDNALTIYAAINYGWSRIVKLTVEK